MWKHLILFWRFAKVTIHYWDKIVLSFVIGNCVELGMLLPPLILRVLFDYIYPYKDLDLLLTFSVLPLFLTFALNGLNVLKAFTDLYVNQSVFEGLYRQFYSKIQRLPMKFFHSHTTGDLMYRMTDDLQVVEVTILTTIPNLMSAIFKLTVLLFICFTLNKSLTILALLGVPFYFVHTHFFSHRLQKINYESREVNSGLFDLLEERLSNIKLIKLFHSWSVEVDHLRTHLARMFLVERKQKLANATYNMISTLLSRFWAAVLALYMGYSIIGGQLTLGEVVAMTSYLVMLQSPFETIAALYSQFVVSAVSFARVAEVLDHPVESEEKEKGTAYTLAGAVTFKDVSFGYEPNRLLLHHISFDVPAGGSLAIVGKSGIGKSSIIDLILRFYDIGAGEILVDNHPIASLSLRSLREQVSLISQDANLFFGTVRDNIAFGIDGEVSDEAIMDAAKRADAHEFILSLPNQYGFSVGTRGGNLSSGQRQKIAIARALLKKPKIIIFDEATAALDGESEKQIQRTIQQLQGQTTVIIIAHRLSSIKVVDRVVVIGNNGTIVEEGPVVDLMAKKGLFYKLYELQLGGFEQFLHQVNILFRSFRRYKRAFSLAAIDVTNFSQLSQQFGDRRLDYFIDDMGIALSLFIRDVDHVSYQKNGRFWMAFPETSVEDATRICQELTSYLRQTPFSQINQPGVEVRFSVAQCDAYDDGDAMVEALQSQMKRPITAGEDLIWDS